MVEFESLKKAKQALADIKEENLPATGPGSVRYMTMIEAARVQATIAQAEALLLLVDVVERIATHLERW